MSKRYHIVPDTGEAKPCSAQEGNCQYASEDAIHGDSIREVQSLYEERMKDQTFNSSKKLNDDEEEYEYQDHNKTSYTIGENRIEEFYKSIEKANRRLAKAGESFLPPLRRSTRSSECFLPQDVVLSSWTSMLYRP